jgi:hypothetical protein
MSNMFQFLIRASGLLPIKAGPPSGNILSTQGLLIDGDTGEIFVDPGVSAFIETFLADANHYANGLPFTALGELQMENDAVAYYDQGIPFTAGGKVAGVINDTVTHIDQGIPYNVLGQIVVEIDTPPDLPGQVQNLIVDVGAVDNSLDISWDEVIVIPAVTSYTYEYKESTSGTWIPVNNGLLLSATISGLKSGVTYNVRVRAENVNGNGQYSATVNGIPEGVPETITLVSTPGIIQVNNSWVEPTAAPAITSYDLQYKLNSSGSWIPFVGFGLSTSVDIYNLDALLYDFRVRAVNSKGDGVFSSIEMATPIAISSPKQVEWNEKGVDTNNPIAFWNNTGGFGASSNLDTFVNQNQWTPQSHKGRNCLQSSGLAYIKTSNPPTSLGSQASFIWAGIPFFLNFGNRRVWGSSFQSSSTIAQEFNTFIEQNGPFLNAGGGMSTDNTEWIIYGRFGSGAGSYIRIIKNDGSTDIAGAGAAGSGLIQPEIIGWDFNQNADEDLAAQYFELTFYDGLLSTSEENALIDSIRQKWFIGFPDNGADAPPTQVQNLIATAGIESAVCSWDALAGSENILDYNLEYKLNSSGTWSTFTPTGLLTQTIFGLDAALYDFRVRARNDLGFGPYSTIDTGTPTAITVDKEVVWNDEGIDTNNPVGFWNNTGTGGASQNLSVPFGTVANLVPSTHKGRPIVTTSGNAGFGTAGGVPSMGSLAYSFWVGKPSFVDGGQRILWDSDFGSSNLWNNTTEVAHWQGQNWGTLPMTTAGNEWIIVSQLHGDGNSLIRSIENNGADTSNMGFAGNQAIQPEAVLWNKAQSGGRDFQGDMYECVFFDGIMSTAEIDSFLGEMKQKWFTGVPE